VSGSDAVHCHVSLLETGVAPAGRASSIQTTSAPAPGEVGVAVKSAVWSALRLLKVMNEGLKLC
jgi:hypothetical protein